MKKNVASQVVGVQMITAADGTAFTGSVTCLVTIDGGTQSASGGTGPTHEGNGFHTYLPTQAETNGDHVAFTFTGTGAIPQTVQIYTTFPQTGDSYALANGAAGFVAIDTVVDAIKVVTDALPDSGALSSLATAAALATVDSNVDAILVDTGTTIPGTIATVDANVDAILVDTGTTLPGLIGTPAADVSADIAAVKADTAAILTDTGTTIPATITTIDTVVDNLNLGIIYGAAATGTLSTTQATSDLTGYADDQLIGRVIVFTSGDAEGEATDITDYASASGLLTFTALTTAPGNGDTFKIV